MKTLLTVAAVLAAASALLTTLPANAAPLASAGHKGAVAVGERPLLKVHGFHRVCRYGVYGWHRHTRYGRRIACLPPRYWRRFY